jgi:phospholipase C
MTGLSQIKHVVVLMLENRSFDNMLGKLYPKSAAFDGLGGTESNPNQPQQPVPVGNRAGTDQTTMSMPDPDPGELWSDINMQIFGRANAPFPAPTMQGFVQNYLAQSALVPGVYDPSSVMNYFTPEQVPVISRLARQFAVCDRWFASAPCQTWPNRFFVHTGTANGYENNEPVHIPYDMLSIYDQFDLGGIENGWKIYFHDYAQTWTLARLWLKLDHFHFYEQFQQDAKRGALPAYSFIEPRYYPHTQNLPNDQHPPHVVTLGEQLIADVYNCLRNGPDWQQTLLIVTYDEHGGCFDHVPPPPAKPPSDAVTTPFNFDRYGVRVPAVIVSPYVQPGTVLRPPGAVPYDHTSILATLRKCFPNLGPPLTLREETAPDVGDALTLPQPTNVGPDHLDALPFTPTPAQVARAQAAPLNGMQSALVQLAAHLPGAVATSDFRSFVENHTQALAADSAARTVPAGIDTSTTASASAFITSRMAPFLASFNTRAGTISPIIDDTKFVGADSGLKIPVRKQTLAQSTLRITNLDASDPPPPYRAGGVPRTLAFNSNVFSITADPAMVPIPVVCQLSNINASTSPIHWRLQALYVVGRYRKVSGGSIPHYASRVLSLGDTWTGKSQSSTFTLFAKDANVSYDNASDRVAGGHAILTVAVQVPGSADWLQDYVHLRLLGTNPTEANVRTYVAKTCATRDNNIIHMANAVFAHENLMKQFDGAFRTGEKYHDVRFNWPPDPQHYPGVAFDFGIGLGQFTHIGEETEAICWDWRENLKAGINELLSDLRATYAPSLSWRNWALRAWSTYNAGSPTSPAGLAYANTLLALPDGQQISSAPLPPTLDHIHETAPIQTAPFPPPPATWPVAEAPAVM